MTREGAPKLVRKTASKLRAKAAADENGNDFVKVRSVRKALKDITTLPSSNLLLRRRPAAESIAARAAS